MRPLHDAVSGEVVAELGAGPADALAMLRFAREVGGPKLRSMSFHARAKMLKGLAVALSAIKEELYRLSRHTGATRRDAWLDVDGGIGTLVVYANKALAELPDDTLVYRGAVERTSRNGTFLGRHLQASRRGVALHVNAYSLPVWGMLEKLAPTLLAGVPAIVKPASVSAFVAVRAVRAMLDAGQLPEGALQLMVGGIGDSLEHLSHQDVVTFTGSAVVGRGLRERARAVEPSVRFNLATESLNFAMLAPDVAADTLEHELFLNEVVNELRTKAGQRGTTIRRVFVPRERLGEIREALRAALEATVMGNPASEDIEMGPLVSVRERDEVRAAVARLRRAAAPVCGGTPSDLRDADPDRGAFFAPALFCCDDPFNVTEPHDVEAFGPVATLMPYRDLGEAAELIRRGAGALAGTVVTTLGPIARQVIAETASHHGRILILNRESAAESTGHGTALPHLLHGGPGRAGDGAELGGLAALDLYMQRAALQGSAKTLAGIARWDESN